MRHEPYTAGSSSTPCRPGWRSPRSRTSRSGPKSGTGHSELGLHLIHEVSRAGFDPGASKVLPAGMWDNHGIPHGWGFILQQVLGGHDLIPIVPVFVNTFWEPNPPTARRCYDFGVALGAAIESFPADLRVGVVASGGLSHFVIDEDLDRAFLKALIDKDREFMVSPRRRPASLRHLRVAQLDRRRRRDRGHAAHRPGRRLPALLPVGGGHRLRHGLHGLAAMTSRTARENRKSHYQEV